MIKMESGGQERDSRGRAESRVWRGRVHWNARSATFLVRQKVIEALTVCCDMSTSSGLADDDEPARVGMIGRLMNVLGHPLTDESYVVAARSHPFSALVSE